jgi:putative endonuclease
MSATREKAGWRGRCGERVAAWYLRFKGWRTLARRVKMPRGVVDIGARRWGTACFVEVKSRASAEQWANAIDEWRMKRVAASAQATASRYASGRDLQRIDVLLLAPWLFPRHIVTAWMP